MSSDELKQLPPFCLRCPSEEIYQYQIRATEDQENTLHTLFTTPLVRSEIEFINVLITVGPHIHVRQAFVAVGLSN